MLPKVAQKSAEGIFWMVPVKCSEGGAHMGKGGGTGGMPIG